MKKQLLFIHGGEAFSIYEDFLNYLRTDSFDPHHEASKRWNRKKVLQDALGSEWEVFRPDMPNKQNSKYEEWKIWFERHFEFLRDGLVLVGHSQGAMFLARYLSENKLPMRCSMVGLVAGAATSDGLEGEDGENFYAELENLKNISELVPKVHLYHSEDDFVVPFKNLEVFSQNIPNAEVQIFHDRGHFLQEDFPELIQNIKNS